MHVLGSGPGPFRPETFVLCVENSAQRSYLRRKAGSLISAVVVIPLLTLGFFSFKAQPACAKEATGHAGVVVKFSEGDEVRECVPFDGSATASVPNTISGLEALQRTGHEVITKDFGGELGVAVCKIDNVGTDDCNFVDAGFWAYYHAAADGTFTFSEVGPSNYRVPDRGIEGWSWSPAGTEAAAPSKATFDEICTTTASEATQSSEKKVGVSSARPWIISGLIVATLVIVILIMRRVARASS